MIPLGISLKQSAGTLSPEDLVDLSRWLNPDYDPDRDFIPPFTEEEDERMSLGRRSSAQEELPRMRSSF